ncbi:MAG: hypothetical protein N3A69_18660, partial [Leptospiraceae bacterium]|nr:hypothetical protein [Leptospiraceae bacterium]
PIKVRYKTKRNQPRIEAAIQRIKKSDFISKLNDILPERFLTNLITSKNNQPEPEYPGMLQTLLQSFSIMENQLVNLYLEYYPPNAIINPPIENFNMLEFYRAKELIELGEKSALSRIPSIKRELKILKIIS